MLALAPPLTVRWTSPLDARTLDDRYPSASGRTPGRRIGSRVPCEPAEDPARHPAGHHGRHSGAHAGPAGAGASAGIRADDHPAAGDLFVGRGDELAGVQVQLAAHQPARGGLRGIHHGRGSRGDSLAARISLGRGIRARRNHLPARRDRAVVRREAHAVTPQVDGHPRGRGTRERCHGADPVQVRRRGRECRRVLARRGDGGVCRDCR